jgi:hypothetical protein
MIRSLAYGLIVCLVVLACSPSTARTLGVTLPGTAEIRPLPAVLVDQAGLVETISAEAPLAAEPSLTNPPGELDVLLVTWIGGTCDHRVEFVFDRGAEAYSLTGVTDRDSGCTLAGVLRSIRIEMSAPVPAADVVVKGP